MACKDVCKLCKKFIISVAVTYVEGTGLIVSIPAGSYVNGEKYCIVVAQAIPGTTPINTPVLIQIGTGQQFYPVTKRNCSALTVCGLRTRTKYSTRLQTDKSSATFRLLGCPCCQPEDVLDSVNGTAQ